MTSPKSVCVGGYARVRTGCDWSGDQTAAINHGSRSDHNIFCDLMGDNFLKQFIPGPTHFAGNKLDLLLCNWPEVIGSV